MKTKAVKVESASFVRSHYSVRRLKDGERVTVFDCGDEDLNDFILNAAPVYQSEMLAITYIMEERATKKVVAFFCLMNDKISLNEFESKTEFNRFRKKIFVNEKRLKSYPAIKIGRFGVDVEARKSGLRLGSFLINFIKYFFLNENKKNMHSGCRFLTVDAYLAAIGFYLKHGFKELTVSDKEDQHTRALIFDLKQLLNE